MEILMADYQEEDHLFIFDNVTTHLKRAEGSQSAMWMTKGPSANFFVEVNDIGEDGKILKKKIPMANGHFSDGQEFRLRQVRQISRRTCSSVSTKSC